MDMLIWYFKKCAEGKAGVPIIAGADYPTDSPNVVWMVVLSICTFSVFIHIECVTGPFYNPYLIYLSIKKNK